MKYTCCERLMWHIIAPASLRYLSKRGWDAPSLKKKAKMIYRQIVKRTPNIGGLTGNSLHICLVAGMIWLSIYEAAEGKMGEECFGNMVVAGMESPIVKASFTRKAKAAFTLAAQQKRADKAVRDNAAPRRGVQLAGGGHFGPGCGGIHHPLPSVRPVHPWPSGVSAPMIK